jgi:hypothetical protein
MVDKSKPKQPLSSLQNGIDSSDELDINPDTSILIALSNTPLKPLDALCELIDNSLDSFRAAEREGIRISQKWIQITIPTAAQVQRGEGVLRVVDNGAGLDRDGLAGALRAGFSTNYKYGSLGLFGVGFNIATSKLGRRTTVTTIKRGSDSALRATVDLPELQRKRKFLVPLTEIPADDFSNGTCVEVSDWWPVGSPNEKFALDLAKLSKGKVAESLGRRYATILRKLDDLGINMVVNEETVVAFEHCVWGSNRSVTRQGVGEVPAKIEFNETLRNTRRCEKDGNILGEFEEKCGVCDGEKITTLRETVRGWIGVQRFDDKSNFGIDIIRNGRAIRVAEKEAFFNFVNDLGVSELEYPIDQATGRIVGEIHLDHVPVDFTKTDFERPSQEWQDAMKFVRGGGLQTKNQGGVENESPLGRIFRAYRRVKKFGKVDMYMGTYSEVGATRISRAIELEFRGRFNRREDGYFDDARWWDRVEGATVPPVNPLIDCPSCGAENLDGAFVCIGCNEILRGKDCRECGIVIAQNASDCPTCGANQTPTVIGPWHCQVCSKMNSSSDESCTECGLPKGSPDPLSIDALSSVSTRLDAYSFDERTFKLIDGRISEPIAISTFSVPSGYLRPFVDRPSIPTLCPPGQLNKLNIYLDLRHSFFSSLGYSPEFAIANQVAQFLQTIDGGASGRGQNALNLTSIILEDLFGESISISIDSLTVSIKELVDAVVDAIVDQTWVGEFYEELLTSEKSFVVKQLQRENRAVELEDLRSTGEYLRLLPVSAFARLFASDSKRWFGIVFAEDMSELLEFAPDEVEAVRIKTVRAIQRALEECADFLDAPSADERVMRRTKSSVQYLDGRLI